MIYLKRYLERCNIGGWATWPDIEGIYNGWSGDMSSGIWAPGGVRYKTAVDNRRKMGTLLFICFPGAEWWRIRGHKYFSIVWSAIGSAFYSRYLLGLRICQSSKCMACFGYATKYVSVVEVLIAAAVEPNQDFLKCVPCSFTSKL